MKILHLIYDDINNPWLGGGGALQTFAISKSLVEWGHEVIVATGNYPNAQKEEEIDGVLYQRIGSAKSYHLSRLTYSLSARQLVRDLDYDILIDDFSAFSPTLSPLFTKKPVVAVIRNFFGTHAIKKYKLLGIMAFLFERLGLKLYQNFVANSPSMAEQLGKMMPGKRIRVIPDSVDESIYSLEPTEGDYIVFLGRIDIYQKGLDTLLESFNRVIERKEVELTIVGGGKDIQKLRGMISRLDLEGKVRLEGKVYEQRKEELLSSCLFVCMPSRYESFGNVAIEAAACAKAVIGTRIPGLCDTIRDGETGILVKVDNPQELSQAMLRLLHDSALRRKLGQAGREWASRFSLEETARLTEQFYVECLARMLGSSAR